MAEWNTQTRLSQMEVQMNQMTNMIFERDAFQTNQMVAKMVEENTQARLAKIEMQLDQMTSMLVEIRNLVMSSSVDTQATPLIDLANSKREFGEYSKDQYSPRSNWKSANEITLIPNPSTCFTQKSKSSDQACLVPKTQEPKKKRFARRQFSHLPRPISQLLPILLERHIVAKEVPRDSPPRFSGFDESKTCIYHMGERGHDVDNCLVLKIKVQNLIDRGMLNFKEPEPTVHQYPLPNHQGVNVIEEYNSDGEVAEELSKEAAEENLDAWFKEESVNVTKPEDTLALE